MTPNLECPPRHFFGAADVHEVDRDDRELRERFGGCRMPAAEYGGADGERAARDRVGSSVLSGASQHLAEVEERSGDFGVCGTEVLDAKCERPLECRACVRKPSTPPCSASIGSRGRRA